MFVIGDADTFDAYMSNRLTVKPLFRHARLPMLMPILRMHGSLRADILYVNLLKLGSLALLTKV